MRDALHVPDNLRHHGVTDDLDLGIREGALLEELGGSEIVAPVHQVHLARVAREVVGFFDGGIATTHDGESLTLEERAVTYRAVGNALSSKFLFAGHAQLDRSAAGGEDHGLRAVGGPAGCLHVEPAVGVSLDSLDRVGDDLGAELFRMLGHLLRQLPALDALEADVVFDQIGVEQLPARRAALDRDRVEHATAGVERGAQPGRAGAYDDHVVDECGTIRHAFRNSNRGGSPSPARARASRARNCTVSNSMSGCCGPASFSSAAAPTTTVPWRFPRARCSSAAAA